METDSINKLHFHILLKVAHILRSPTKMDSYKVHKREKEVFSPSRYITFLENSLPPAAMSPTLLQKAQLKWATGCFTAGETQHPFLYI